MPETVIVPSVQLDLVREDLGNATQGTVAAGSSEPYALSNGQTLTVAVDGGGPQTVTFLAVDFDDISQATAAEVAAILNGGSGLTGATADGSGGTLSISTDTYGSGGSIQVTGGTANAVLGFSTSAVPGTDYTAVVQPINRIPEDGEVLVPRDSNVEIELHDSGGTAPATGGVVVYINGVTAYDGGAGGFQAGYSGSTSNPDAATLRIVVNPSADFSSDITVTVRVTESVSSLDTTYSFTTADETAPTVLSAEARDKAVVRLAFDEPVRQIAASNSDDALNPSNYTFTGQSVPYVAVTPVSVATVDASTVDITLDVELGFGVDYLITVQNVADIVGNVITAPNNTASFTALVAEGPLGRRFRYLELLPQVNRTEDQTGELALWAACIQDVIWLLLGEIDRWATILDPDTAPEDFVDAMLADLGNPFQFVDLSLSDKRRLLRVLVDIYKAKGTEQGIIAVVLFLLGLTITITVFNGLGWELAAADSPTLDGQNPPAGPGDELSSTTTEPADAAELGPGERRLLYTFNVVSPIALTAEQRSRIEDIVDLMKPAHTHLGRIIEPDTAEVIDHVELGLSELGQTGGPSGTWQLH